MNKMLIISPTFKKTLAKQGIEYNKNFLTFWCSPDYVNPVHACVFVCVFYQTIIGNGETI